MEHVNVRFKDVPECMHIAFGCSENMRRVLQAHLEAGNYTQLAEALDTMDVDIWLPSWSNIGNIGPTDGVLLCKKGEEGDRLGDSTLWGPDAEPAPGEDPRVCADNCTRDDGNKECWFWMQGGDSECTRIKCKSFKGGDDGI